MFNELSRLGEWSQDNPLKDVRQYRTEEQEMAFLSKEQIDQLLQECENSTVPELATVVRLCLSTDARWSEAEGL